MLGMGAALLMGGMAGCTPYLQDPGRREAQAREDFLLIEESVRRMEGRIEGLEIENRRLQDGLDTLRRQQELAAQRQRETAEAQTEDWEQRLRAIEAARAQDRQEIVEGLTRRMTDMLQAQRPAPSRRPAGPRTGFEHEVKPGETLSTIAVAYGVRMQVILDANSISNPNLLRVGQVLFIPEP
jgi:nucleoid-associated protein YgaU